MTRTRLSVCARKARFASEDDAMIAATGARVPLRTYRCDRCRHIHLTSRTKGKRVAAGFTSRDPPPAGGGGKPLPDGGGG